MSFEAPPLPTIGAAPAPPPMFGADPNSTGKPKKKSMQPTFLGTGATPQAGQLGQKTLLGT